MATQMGIRELRDSLTSTVRRVQRGETIEVTHHGVPVAVLSPITTDRIERLIASGDVSPPTPLESPYQPREVTGLMTASEALEVDRSER